VAIDGRCRDEDGGQDLTRRIEIGGAEGDRTPDLRIANATLSQLSYGPVSRFQRFASSAGDYGDGAAPCQAWLHRRELSRASAIRVLRDLRTPAADATVPAPIAARRGSGLMYAFLHLVNTLITIFIWLLIAQAILSWLLAFGVVNRYNRVVATANDFLWRITEPALRPIRSFLPNLGGIDISPVILILLLYFLRDLMFEYLA
jgi:YggT family protein